MILLKRFFFPFSLLLISFPLLGINVGDSTKSPSRLSVGVETSVFSIMKFRLPNRSNLNPDQPYCDKCESEKKPTHRIQLLSDYQQLSLKYTLHKNFKLDVSIMHIHEGWGEINVNYDTIRPNVIEITVIGFVQNRYVSLSPSLTGRIKNNTKGTFYTNLEAGVNIDFIYHESRKKGQVVIDSIYSGGGPGGDVVLSDKYLPEMTRNGKMNFNRISPFIHLYLEWYNKKQTLSFSLGSAYTFESIYQIKNTAEFYKCFKITPLTFGLTYHFK